VSPGPQSPGSLRTGLPPVLRPRGRARPTAREDGRFSGTLSSRRCPKANTPSSARSPGSD